MIEVKDLVKRYKKAKVNAVDHISFSIPAGQFFSLLGPNGAGKTTTINILTTTLAKTSGSVTIAGYDLDKNPSKVRRNIGVIFQQPSLDENLTAEENIRFHAVLYGLYPFRPFFSLMPKAYKDRVYQLAELLEIKNDLFRPIKTYSGGMKRKLEIIRSFIHEPKVLFLDEPTSGLDPISRKNLWEYLTEVRREKKTTIFLTTHYLDEAENSEMVCVINNGKIITLGTPGKIKKDLVDEYLLIDAKDKTKLRQELKKHHFLFEEKEKFKINLESGNVQQVIKAIDTPLTYVKLHVPTLEEAYVELIEQNNNEN